MDKNTKRSIQFSHSLPQLFKVTVARKYRATVPLNCPETNAKNFSLCQKSVDVAGITRYIQ
jgi:hypothetical protein